MGVFARMMAMVTDLIGIKDLPSGVVGIRKWLRRNKILLEEDGNRFTF